jgi:tetratricopeptide (TPR) repeat protein
MKKISSNILLLLQQCEFACSQKDWGKTIDLSIQILKIDNAQHSAHIWLSAAYISTNRVGLAIEHLKTSLKNWPNSPPLLNNMGIACIAVKNYSAALIYFEEADRLSPTVERKNNIQLCKDELSPYGYLFEANEFPNGIRHKKNLPSNFIDGTGPWFEQKWDFDMFKETRTNQKIHEKITVKISESLSFKNGK